MLRLQIKYSSSAYSWLCFRHAVQEAMRGEDIEPEIDNSDAEYHLGPSGHELKECKLCSMEHNTEENALAEWYYNYVKAIESLIPKQPTEKELREDATKLRSKRKR